MDDRIHRRGHIVPRLGRYSFTNDYSKLSSKMVSWLSLLSSIAINTAFS